MRALGLALLVLTGILSPARSAEDLAQERALAGPVTARVVKVRDGDTVEVEALIWPNQTVRTAVRLRGVDAPELKSRCESEHEAAQAARDRLTALLAGGSIQLTEIGGDKYFGRVLARVSTDGVPDVSARLLNEGLVAPYRGDKRRDWCDGKAASVAKSAVPNGRPG